MKRTTSYQTVLLPFLLIQAGIGSMTNPGQLIIALEPETAALFCMERKISKLETERVSDLEDAKLAEPQTQYMVVDIGGDNHCFILLSSDAIYLFQN